MGGRANRLPEGDGGGVGVGSEMPHDPVDDLQHGREQMAMGTPLASAHKGLSSGLLTLIYRTVAPKDPSSYWNGATRDYLATVSRRASVNDCFLCRFRGASKRQVWVGYCLFPFPAQEPPLRHGAKFRRKRTSKHLVVGSGSLFVQFAQRARIPSPSGWSS